MNTPVLVTPHGAVAVITMNRPAAMNAMSLEMRIMLAEAFRQLGADAGVRAIVLTGAGDRAFTAGLDLKEVGGGAGVAFDDTHNAAHNDPVAALTGCGKPVIAAINGVTVTGGFELALACDMMVASTAARFADTHVKVRVMPGWGLSQRLPRLIGIARAKQMSLTGTFIDAGTALGWGLVNEVVAPAELLPRALEIAHAIAEHDPDMAVRVRAVIDDGMALPFGAALALEVERAREFNDAIPAAAIEARRTEVFRSNRA